MHEHTAVGTQTGALSMWHSSIVLSAFSTYMIRSGACWRRLDTPESGVSGRPDTGLFYYLGFMLGLAPSCGAGAGAKQNLLFDVF